MTLIVHGRDDDDYSVGMFFDLNNQPYTINQEPGRDVVTVEYNNKKITVKFEIFHNYRLQLETIRKELDNDKDLFVITNIVNSDSNPRVVFNDFLFNRTRAYYLQFPFRSNTKKWYHSGQINYMIPDHDSIRHKIYVAPNKTYENSKFRNLIYRKRLVSMLQNNYRSIGYLGNCHDSNCQDLFLYSNTDFPLGSLAELESSRLLPPAWSLGYSPPHNEYYKNTFISIYGETVERASESDNVIAVTEKTFDPLIKGHFIMPFSVSGFVQHLKDHYGFKFPNFIDYSYDAIDDAELRYTAYEKEVKRLLALDIEQWSQNWSDNFDSVIRHNQLVFFERPFDRIDFYKLLEDVI